MQDFKASFDISTPATYLHICYTQSQSDKGPPANPICEFMHSTIKIYFNLNVIVFFPSQFLQNVMLNYY